MRGDTDGMGTYVWDCVHVKRRDRLKDENLMATEYP
jgi:hypothetical protein